MVTIQEEGQSAAKLLCMKAKGSTSKRQSDAYSILRCTLALVETSRMQDIYLK